jgi:hypothetical protein
MTEVQKAVILIMQLTNTIKDLWFHVEDMERPTKVHDKITIVIYEMLRLNSLLKEAHQYGLIYYDSYICFEFMEDIIWISNHISKCLDDRIGFIHPKDRASLLVLVKEVKELVSEERFRLNMG